MGISSIPRREIFLFAFLVAVSFALRAWRLDLMEFKRDEAWMAHYAIRIAEGDFFWHGLVSSVGVVNPPGAPWIFSLAALWSLDPLVMVLIPVLMGTGAVAVTWLLARRYAGAEAAWCAALLFAVSPSAVYLSRKIWAQDLFALVGAVALFAAFEWIAKGRPIAAILCAAAASLQFQIHLAGAVWGAFLPLVAWFGPRRPGVWFLAVAIAAAIAAPYGGHLVATGGREILVAREHLLEAPSTDVSPGRIGALVLVAWDGLFRDVFGWGDLAPAGFGRWTFAALVVAGGVLAWRSRHPPMRALLLFAAGSYLFLGIAIPYPHPTYGVAAFPAPYILAGVGAAGFLQKRNWRALIGALVAATWISGVGTILASYYWLEKTHGGPDEYGTTYGAMLDTVESIRADAAGLPVAIEAPNSSGLAYVYLLALQGTHVVDPGEAAAVYVIEEEPFRAPNVRRLR